MAKVTRTTERRMKMYCLSGMKEKTLEAEQHIKVLEELREMKICMLPYLKEHGKGTAYDDTKDVINALSFAIDFMKWGMK